MMKRISFLIAVTITTLLSLQTYGRTPITKKTVAEFLSMDDKDSTLCLLKGVVCRVRNYDKGRLFIDDGTGTVLIYNVFDPKHNRSFPGTDVRMGDTLTVIGRRAVYDGRVIEMKNAMDSFADGRVVVSFVIGRDGSVLYPTIVEGAHPALNEEVIRVFKKAPKWKPGIVDGQPVRVSMKLPVIFSMEK